MATLESTEVSAPRSVTSKPVQTKTVVTRIKKRKQRNRAIWMVLAGILLLVVIILFVKSGKEKAVVVQTERVTRKSITEIVQATGKIQPETQVKVAPEVPGEIIELPVKEGDHVSRGQMLAKIKPTTFQAQFEQAQASVSSSKAISEVQHAQMLKAQSDFSRAEELRTKKLISEQDFQQAKSSMDVAEASYNSAKYNIAAAESQLAQIGEALRKTSVFAPMAGVVTNLISRLGEKVVGTSQFTGTEMMTISDLTVMNAMVDVDENDVVNIKVGNNVKVTIDAFPGRTFTGAVIEIANSAKLSGNGTQDQSTNFTVKVRLSDFGTTDLRPGMSCTARIETQTHESVLAVPLMAVTRREGITTKPDTTKKSPTASADSNQSPTIVFVINGTRVKSVPVTTGISDNSYVEILSGLSGNEEIVKGNYRAVSKDLSDKALVKIDNTGKTTQGTD